MGQNEAKKPITVLGDGEYATPFEHLAFMGSTTDIDTRDYLMALGLFDSPSVRRLAKSRLLTVLTMNPVNSDKEKYDDNDRDPVKVFQMRQGTVIQGAIMCFAGVLGMHKRGLTIRVDLATPANVSTGQTTDRWKIRVVRSRDKHGNPIELEGQEVITGDELAQLALNQGSWQDLFLDLEDAQPGQDFRWLRLRQHAEIPDDNTMPEPTS